jgi:hypothetical protein
MSAIGYYGAIFQVFLERAFKFDLAASSEQTNANGHMVGISEEAAMLCIILCKYAEESSEKCRRQKKQLRRAGAGPPRQGPRGPRATGKTQNI